MPSKSTPAIEPDRLYKIAFSRTVIDGDGKKYIPRVGVSVKVRGRVLETLKDQVDHYEAI